MMGPTHAATGALAGAGVAWYLESNSDVEITIPVLIAVVWVTAGAAILPDLDHPQATIARTWGWVSKWVSQVVNTVSEGVVNATRGRRDKPCENGHRMFTHTLLFAVLTTLVTYAFVSVAGMWGAAIVLYVLISLGIQTLFRRQARKFGPIVANIAAIVLVWLVMRTAGELVSPVVLAAVVGLGCVVHMLGDLPTEAGIPVFAPFVSVQGKRWGKLRLPRGLRVRVGGGADTVVCFLSGIATVYCAVGVLSS